eukprot:GHVT01008926.1.p1 GENE.GHVT01008926.1~~GHVT01008926.1.p1  ORF type:complete len:213 (+),score=24.69 GHVT01008926.1:1607-2245(+)
MWSACQFDSPISPVAGDRAGIGSSTEYGRGMVDFYDQESRNSISTSLHNQPMTRRGSSFASSDTTALLKESLEVAAMGRSKQSKIEAAAASDVSASVQAQPPSLERTRLDEQSFTFAQATTLEFTDNELSIRNQSSNQHVVSVPALKLPNDQLMLAQNQEAIHESHRNHELHQNFQEDDDEDDEDDDDDLAVSTMSSPRVRNSERNNPFHSP